MKYEGEEYQTNTGSWLLSFILGGLIGGAVALLLAPKSGRQTREHIRDMAQDAKKRRAPITARPRAGSLPPCRRAPRCSNRRRRR